MTTKLRFVVDQVLAPVPGQLGRYTAALTRAMIAAAPPHCEVEGIVSSSPHTDYELLEQLFPGLAGLYKSSLARRELAAAWQFGITTSPGGGIIHSPSLFAPLRKHESPDQTVVTVHDLLPWTNPEALTTATVAWRKAMMKRARKYADAIVVPTHALAEQLHLVGDFDDRVRVIGTAARPGLTTPAHAATRREQLKLPSQYLVTAGTLEARAGVVDVIAALGRPGSPEIALVVLGPESWGELHLASVADEAGIRADLVRAIDPESTADLAAIISGATAYIAPAHTAGAGTSLIEAFALGAPVIHSDAPAYVEISAESGRAVALDDGAPDAYPARLAEAITAVVEQTVTAQRLSIAGRDRARAFSWRDSAERLWQLHADL